MAPVKVGLVSLGNLKNQVNMDFLERWKSQLFSATNCEVFNFLEEPEGPMWNYTDQQMINILKPHSDFNITIGIINAPLENNYYMRRLNQNTGVISIYEMAKLVTAYGSSVESFIVRNIYEVVLLYKANHSLIPPDAYTWAHADIRGCLFDMNASKDDIVFSMHKPTLCDNCRTRLRQRQIDAKLLSAIDRELPRIKRKLYFKISDHIKSHPIIAILVAAAFATFLNILSALMYDYAKPKLAYYFAPISSEKVE